MREPARRIDAAQPAADALAAAIDVLRRGDLLIYPTDTLYALGCVAANAQAARRVREAKGRDDGKPLPLIAGSVAQVELLAGPLGPAVRALALGLWPGPVTLVLPAAPGLPAEVTAGGSTVAVRVPASPLAQRLCDAAGPLVSTSANRSGRPAPATCAEAEAEVGDAAALALDAGPGGGPPSTLVDATGAEPRLLRLGAIPWERIAEVWRRGRA